MKKRIILVLVLVFSLLLSGCFVKHEESEDKIKLNGSLNTEVEIGEEFIDSGITAPEGYTVKKEEGSYTITPDCEYEIKYKVYSEDGELVKELTRFVRYKDSTAPIYEETSITYLEVNKEYKLSDFIVDYSDNYNKKEDIIVISNLPKEFEGSGEVNIEIEFKDTKGNTSKYNKTFIVKYDLEDAIDILKQLNMIEIKETEDNEKYLEIKYDSYSTITYYKDSKKFILKKLTPSTLASNALVEVTFTLGDTKNTTFEYILNENEVYFKGYKKIDSSIIYENLSINSFDRVENDLNLNENQVVAEFNTILLDHYNEFSMYKYYDWQKLFD